MKMFRDLVLLLGVIIGAGVLNLRAQASEPSIYSNMFLPSPLGKDRVLVVCLPEKHGEEALNQFYDSVNWNEYSDRHLTIVEMSRRAVQSVTVDNNKARREDFGDQLRRIAKCTNDLQFILIGKDMSVKSRWDGSVRQEDLFQLIDAMPMRQYEMRQKAK